MCKYCKNEHLIDTTTTHVVDLKNQLIIIRNVPCKACDQCGETYLSMETSRQLEKIVNEAKKIVQEVSIINYKNAA